MKAPVVVRVANCRSVSTTPDKARAIFTKSLTKRGDYGVPQVVLASECSDFDAEIVAEFAGWEAAQFGEPKSARRGSALAWRDARLSGKARLVVGSLAGEGIRERSAVTARLKVNGHSAEFTAGHAPPDRASDRQRQWLEEARRWQGILGADFNQRPDELERRFLRQVRGVRGDVLALLVPRHIPCSPARPVDIGSDHPAVDVVLWPDRKEK